MCGTITPDRITTALRDITPKQLAEAKEVAFAKRLSAWRALTAILYRAHTTPKRGRPKVAERAAMRLDHAAVLDRCRAAAGSPFDPVRAAAYERREAAAELAEAGDAATAASIPSTGGSSRPRRGGTA